MDARHRIRIMAAAFAVALLTGGRAAAQDEPTPDTELGRAAEECIAAEPTFEDFFTFYDDGLSVFVHSGFTDAAVCMVRVLNLPDWLAPSNFVGVLGFADWSVLRAGNPAGTGDLLIMANEVAPNS
jgi:hypothetical protein